MTVIVILALVALFIGLRLYSVLGERTGHEQQPILKPADPDARVEPRVSQPAVAAAGAADSRRHGLRADRRAGRPRHPRRRSGFDVARFLEGAKAAYRMILEAFWKGDLDALRSHVDDHVYETFAGAVEQRKKDGLTLDNRLVAIEQAVIAEATLERGVAVVTVRFEADIAAVTRNAEGEVVAGSLSDAVQTRDLWTFRRDTGVARSQLAADRDRRGRVRLLAPRGARRRSRPARRLRHPARSRRLKFRRAGARTGCQARARTRPAAAVAGRPQCGRDRRSSSKRRAVLKPDEAAARAGRLPRELPGADAPHRCVGPDPGRRLATRCAPRRRRSTRAIAPGFFYYRFDWVRVGDGQAFATGYYEPEIEGSRTPQPGYVPIYALPPDLVRCTKPDGTSGPRPDRRDRHLRALFHPRRDRGRSARRQGPRARLGRGPGRPVLPRNPGLGPHPLRRRHA